MLLSGGMTVYVIGLDDRLVFDRRNRHRRLAGKDLGEQARVFGERCWTTTKARPVSIGSARSSSETASSPPAEAPIPTIAWFAPAGVSSD